MIVGAVIASTMLGLAMSTRIGAPLVALAAVATATAWVLAHKWGAIAVALPAFVVPFAPSVAGLRPTFLMAVLTAALAVVYWLTGAGRPRLSRPALTAICLLGAGSIVLSFTRGASSFQPAITDPLLWSGGLLFGMSIAAQPEGRRAVLVLAVPLGLLACGEALGVTNPWAGLQAGAEYAELASREDTRRALSTFGHPLVAGAVLAGLGLLWVHERAPVTLKYLATLAGIAGSIATVSRSALLGLAAGGAVILLQTVRSPKQLAAFALVVVAIVTAGSQVDVVRTSLQNRLNQQNSEQTVRRFALTELRDDAGSDPVELLLGGGAGYSTVHLQEIGGVEDYFIYDNQYVTAIRDYGLILLALTGVLLYVAFRRSSAAHRREVLPALAAILVALAFVDGLHWTSLGLFFWVLVGLLLSPAGSMTESNKRAAVALGAN